MLEIISGINKRLTPLEGGNSSCEHHGNTLENAGNPMTSALDTQSNPMQAGHNRNSHNGAKNWGVLTADERRINVLAGQKMQQTCTKCSFHHQETKESQ